MTISPGTSGKKPWDTEKAERGLIVEWLESPDSDEWRRTLRNTYEHMWPYSIKRQNGSPVHTFTWRDFPFALMEARRAANQ
jgi:hypothetical protein